MDFAMLPPEINSGRMYTGPGLGSMLAAASAWDGLATELYSTAASYGAVVSGLTAGTWLGPASMSMAAAAAPYVAWLSATAARAEVAAAQAKAAVIAYETAFAMTVPPPVIAANRSLLMALVVTNFFGQNTPAIAATEAHYAEMWGQDAAAMYGYAEASLAASMLTPFTPPPPTTNLAGLAGHAAALTPAASTNVATPAQIVSQLLEGAVVELGPRVVGVSIGPPIGPPNLVTRIAGMVRMAQATRAEFVADGLGSALETWVGPGPLPSILAGADRQGVLYGAPAGVLADLGQAESIGGLSVPQGWIAATPVISPAAMVSPLTSVSTVPSLAACGPGGPWRGMALAGLVGRAAGSADSSAAAP